MPEPSVQRQAPALRLIILYKLARALGSIVAATALAIFDLTGVTDRAEALASRIHVEATSALALKVSALAVTLLRADHVWIIAVALALDAGVLVFEAWALHTGKIWGEWLVVAASCGLLPFEVAALVRHTSTERIAILILNLAIVGYLLSRIHRHR